MKKLILVSGLALALAACGGEDEQSAEQMMDDAAETAQDQMDDAAAAAEDQMDEMADAAEEMTDEAEEMMDEAAGMEDQGMSLAEIQSNFVADYAQDDATVVTDSGLMYRVVREGEGASPGPADIVEVHYEGRLADGTVFDSSYERDETIEFPLNRVIPGWTEGLQYMQEGAEYQFVIPPQLGYGSRGAGEVIPPDAVLIFDVELLNVTPVE